jgi:hypothetical protein
MYLMLLGALAIFASFADLSTSSESKGDNKPNDDHEKNATRVE